MPYGGHTETFSLTEISAVTVQDYIANHMHRNPA